MGKDGLEFKKYEKDQAKRTKARAHAMSLDRVTSASAASLRGQGWAPTADAKDSALPTEAADEGSNKRPAETSAGDGKGGGKGKMSVKELTKLKRFKGQSGIDHNGKVGKPEIWMQMRLQFD